MTSPAPLDLLKLSLQGDSQAYGQLLKWLADHCKIQLRHGLKNYYHFPAQSYDDITQEVLLTFHQTHQSFDLSRPLLPWINSIIKHKMIDFIRRKDFVVTMKGVDLQIFQEVWCFDDEHGSLDEQAIKTLVDKLPDPQRTIFHLSKIEGFSSKEIAKKLNLTDSNVKVIIHRTIKELQKLASSLKDRVPE